jgi:EAL domain-containing protein (putative c-di-GMP-specific phosphodiesterase class I)
MPASVVQLSPRPKLSTKQDDPLSRLLIVDDDAAITRLIKRAAEELGFEVKSTSDPEDFMGTARQWRPSVIVLDLQMPGRDGIQLLRELAEDKCPAQVILTSGVDRKLLEGAQDLGAVCGLKMAGVLEKPFGFSSLRDFLTPFKPVSREAMTSELAVAIASDQLFLEYQPKLDMRCGQISGVEALVRWHHPLHGRVPPDQFVALAEESDLIHGMTNWVLAAATKQAADWAASGLALTVAVNVSARDLLVPDLPDRLEAHCRAAGLDPARLVVELTETSAMRDPAQMLDVLIRLRLKGFGLAIDDFGTGYSSLVQLRKMPFTEVKIDRSFVKSIPEDHDCTVISKTIVELAHNLGLLSVAEGVENQAALDCLAKMGCDMAQGYHLSRPVAPASIPDIVRQRRITEPANPPEPSSAPARYAGWS